MLAVVLSTFGMNINLIKPAFTIQINGV